MEFKLISDTENPLFNRREVEGEIHADVTPSRQDVAKMLAEKLSVSSENIKIRTIIGKFGSRVFIINANIYKSVEDKNKIELQKKKDVEAEKKIEEAKAKPEAVESVAPAEEKPKEAEAPKEELKQEEATAEQPTEEKSAEPEKSKEEAPKEEDKQEEVKEDKSE